MAFRNTARSVTSVQDNSHRRDHQPQQVVPVITSPWKKLAMDVVGPITRTKTGYRYILTVVDLATKYPVAVPLKRVDAETTCTELGQHAIWSPSRDCAR